VEYAAWLFNPRGWVTAIQRELQAVVGDSRIAFTNQPWFVASCLAAIAAAIIGILGLLMAGVVGDNAAGGFVSTTHRGPRWKPTPAAIPTIIHNATGSMKIRPPIPRKVVSPFLFL